MQNTYGILCGKDEREVRAGGETAGGDGVGWGGGASVLMGFSQRRAAADGLVAQHKAGRGHRLWLCREKSKTAVSVY